MKYAFLNGKIAERGIKKLTIAAALGITQKAFKNKLDGRSPFTWREACTVQRTFFPDIDKDVLFAEAS